MDLIDLSTVDVILISNSASIAALPYITEVSTYLQYYGFCITSAFMHKAGRGCF